MWKSGPTPPSTPCTLSTSSEVWSLNPCRHVSPRCRVAEYAAPESAANYSAAYTNLSGLLVELEAAVLRPLSKRSAGYEAAAAVSS